MRCDGCEAQLQTQDSLSKRMALIVPHSQGAVDGKKGVRLGGLDHLKSAKGRH